MNSKVFPGKDITLSYAEVSVNLHVDMGVGIGGDKWPAAEAFCSLISKDEWRSLFSSLFNSKRIVELGSGNALPGVLIDLMFSPTEVIITDLETHIPLIESNIRRNSASRCRGESFDWFSPPPVDKYDVVLALECVYREDLFQPLINSLTHCCHQDSVVFLGLTRAFASRSFFSLLKKKFYIRLVPGTSWQHSPACSDDVGLFVLSPL